MQVLLEKGTGVEAHVGKGIYVVMTDQNQGQILCFTIRFSKIIIRNKNSKPFSHLVYGFQCLDAFLLSSSAVVW